MGKLRKERVKSHPGISLQQLTGHLAQLPLQFPEVFAIRNNNVYGATENHHATSSVNGSAESVASASDGAASEMGVTCVTDVTGTMYRLFTLYGFISIESPINTSVYFDMQSLENAQHTSLPSSGFQVGDSVVFDVQIGPKDCKAKF
ncbi:hypothetical protein HPB48_018129 [Haemaphysalis longicornis]|uniref:CSD domain-containing protein n=1 Tax=Haemaphysalis longicornis TaxID=44386 RepID=A0A9J6FVI1_HAELO|nr:hypothetical protein HPB48_018129 [Haemaphysalis longicornis]